MPALREYLVAISTVENLSGRYRTAKLIQSQRNIDLKCSPNWVGVVLPCFGEMIVRFFRLSPHVDIREFLDVKMRHLWILGLLKRKSRYTYYDGGISGTSS